MGTKYPGVTSSGYNSGAPADDGSQVASNLVTWAGVKTKLADPIKTLADAENTALVAALDLSARAISSPDTAIASDHWKTLQVTGSTTITLSSAASMGAGYEVGIFNAGTGVVTVTPGAASDTINGVSASVTVSIKGTKIFRTNQALTGYNVVGGYDPQTVTASTSVVTPLVTVSGSVNSGGASAVSGVGLTTKGIDGTTSYIGQQIFSGTTNNGVFTQYSDGLSFNFSIGVEPTTGDFSFYDGRFPGTAGTKRFSIARATGATFWGTGTANFGTITKRKTADESVTSSTALQDDDHLTFAIAANEEWVADYFIDAGAGILTTGIKVAITVPSGATLNADGEVISLGGQATPFGGRTTTSGTAFISIASASPGDVAKVFVSVWVLNGATPGSVTLQFAQGTSSGTAITFRKGSHMQATRVA